MNEQQKQHLIAELKLVLKRLAELNRDDEAGIRTVLRNIIKFAEGTTS